MTVYTSLTDYLAVRRSTVRRASVYDDAILKTSDDLKKTRNLKVSNIPCVGVSVPDSCVCSAASEYATFAGFHRRRQPAPQCSVAAAAAAEAMLWADRDD